MTLYLWLVIFTFIAVFAIYQSHDLWGFDGEYDRVKENYLKHIGVMAVLAFVWPVTWLVLSMVLLLGDWDGFVAWYDQEISWRLNK